MVKEKGLPGGAPFLFRFVSKKRPYEDLFCMKFTAVQLLEIEPVTYCSYQ